MVPAGRDRVRLRCLASLFIWVVVYRPVKELIDGTHRVADGDLTTACRCAPTTNWATWPRSFNKMTAEVGGVQAKIEDRVRRKTAELERVHKTLLQLGEDGVHRQTGGHGGARDQQSAVRHPDLCAAGAARVAEARLPGRDEMAEQLQTIERESKRCGEMVKNLLTFSRQAPSIASRNDLNTVVHRAVLLVKHKLEMQNIELQETWRRTCRRWSATPTRSNR